MSVIEKAQQALKQTLTGGAEQAQVWAVAKEKQEFNIDAGELSLLRTTFDENVTIKSLRQKKQGVYAATGFGSDKIQEASEKANELAEAAQPDEANAIAPEQPPQKFEHGPLSANQEQMQARLSEFLATVRKRFPKTIFEQCIFDHSRKHAVLVNSNGAEYEIGAGVYHWTAMFTTKDGKRTTSFNYASASFDQLENDLLEQGGLESLLRQQNDQLDSRAVGQKFKGDVIFTPHTADTFLATLLSGVKDGTMIANTSVYKNRLGQTVAPEFFNVRLAPCGDEVAEKTFVSMDGFVTKDCDLVRGGVLKSYMLSQYGARKTGLERSANLGEAIEIEPGSEPLEKLIAGVERGILLGRFSGGYPAQNGDFSGVAKNSFYIEGGKIRFALKETMVSGNLVEMLETCRGLSRETINFGSFISPWIHTTGATIS